MLCGISYIPFTPGADDLAVAIHYQDRIRLVAALQHIDHAGIVHRDRRRVADLPSRCQAIES